MNNLKYHIFIESVTKKQFVKIDLLADDIQDNQVEINQLLSSDKDYFELEIILGSGIGQLVEKSSQLEKFYQSITDKLKSLIDTIQNIFGLENILFLTYINFDCLFSPEEILCQFIRVFQFISDLNIYLKKEISDDQFNQILQAVSFNREKLENIHLEFSLKEEQTNIIILKQLEYIKCLSLCNLTQQNQLNVFKLAKEIKEIEIINNYYSRLKIQTIFDELPFLKNSLERLQLKIHVNLHLQSEYSLKSIEKLENLKNLHLEAANIKNQNFDVTKLKKLESLKLIFSDAINYLSNHSNLPQLVELEIVVGSCDANKLSLKQLNNLRVLNIIIKQTKVAETKKTIQCLEKFSEIAHQLNQLELYFDQSSQFFINITGPQLIQAIGIILQKCTEETKIYLNNNNCQFNTEKTFELATQMIKIKNYKQFYLNDICIYDQLEDFQEISDEKLENKFPYYLSIFSQSQNQKSQIVSISWIQLRDNFSILQKHISLFQNFKAFSLSSMQSYCSDNYLSHNFLQIISEKVEFLRLPYIFCLKKVVDDSKHLKQLKKIEIWDPSLKQFMDNMGSEELKKRFSKKLHIKFNRILNYSEFQDDYKKFLEYEGYIFEISIDSIFRRQDFDDLFQYILNDKNIIYLKLFPQYGCIFSYEDLQNQEMYQKLSDTVNDFSSNVQNQVLSTNAFNKFFVSDMNLNPKLILLDLYY